MATRRSNGEGSAPYKRPDGRWQIKIRTTQTTTGQPHRKTIYGKTRAEAVSKAKEYTNNLESGVKADTTKTTLHNWSEHWLNHIASQRVREQTLKSYRGYMERWAYPTTTATMPLTKIKPVHIDAIYQRMREHGLSENTVNHMHKVLSICFKAAVDRDLLAKSPMDRVPLPQFEAYEPKIATPAQAQAMVKELRNDEENGLAFTVALALGPRQGERLALCWDDIDLSTGKIHIRHGVVMRTWKHGCAPEGEAPRCGRKQCSYCPQRWGGGFVMGPPKNRAGVRENILPGPLIQMFKEHKARQHRRQLEAGREWVGAVDAYGKSWDLVFTDRRGRLVRPNDDWRAWRAFTAKHGLEGMRVHDARHTAATLLLAMGVAPQVTMDMLGWSSPEMLRRYQHVLDDMRIEAAGKVSTALFG